MNDAAIVLAIAIVGLSGPRTGMAQKPSKPSVPAVSKERKERARGMVREGIAAADKGDWKAAIAVFEKALVVDPSEPEIYYELALAQLGAKKVDDAAATVVKGRKVDPEYAGFFVVLGSVYDIRKLPDLATREYGAGLKIHPTDPQLLLNLGITQHNRDRRSEALETWERGVESNPRFPSLRYHLAVLWSQSRDPIFALFHGETYRNLDPSSPRSEAVGRLLHGAMRRVVQKSPDGGITISLVGSIVIDLPSPEEGGGVSDSQPATRPGARVRAEDEGASAGASQPVTRIAAGDPELPIESVFEMTYALGWSQSVTVQDDAWSIPVEVRVRH